MRAVASHRARCRRNTRAVDQSEQRPQLQGGVHDSLAVRFLSDVAMDEDLAEFLGKRLTGLVLDVGYHRLAAMGDEPAHRAGAQAGSAARHDECLSLDFHLFSLGCRVGKRAAQAESASKMRSRISSTVPRPVMR